MSIYEARLGDWTTQFRLENRKNWKETFQLLYTVLRGKVE